MHIKPLYILHLLVLAVVVGACTNKPTTTTTGVVDGNFQLNIGVMSSMDYLPLAVAQANGFFEQEGVTIIIDKFYSANERDAAFQSGNLDGTILDYTGAAIQRAGGINLKLTSQCDGTFVLIAGKDAEINSIQDLKDKRIAVSRNTVIDFCTDAVLQKANIPLNKVRKTEINKIPLRLEMLNNGRVDATMLPDPFATMAMEEGNKSILDINELDLHVTGIAFHESVIDMKGEAIKNFYRAYNTAVEHINSQPASTFESLLISEIGAHSSIVSRIQLPKYTKAQLPQKKDLQQVEQWLKTQKLVPADFDINTLIATGLIP